MHTQFGRMVLLPLALLLALVSCSEQPPIRIAFLGASSGQNSEVVVSVRDSIQMYIDQVNQAGGVNGRNVVLDSFDNQLDVELNKKLFQQIISDEYKFVLGPVFSQMAEATLNSIKDQDILVISPTMSSDYLQGKDDNFLRVCLNSSAQAEFIARHLLNMGYNRLAVVFDESNAKYTEALYKKTWATVQEHGVKLVKVASFNKNNSPDMTNIAQEIIDAQPDSLLMAVSAIDAASLAQQIRKTDQDIQFIGSSWSQTNDLIEQGGRPVNGMVLVAVYQGDKTTPHFKEFEQNFSERYGRTPSFPSILGHDAAYVMITSMQAVDTITPMTIKQQLLEQRTYQGLTHQIIFDDFGDIEGSYYLVTVKDGRFEPFPSE